MKNFLNELSIVILSFLVYRIGVKLAEYLNENMTFAHRKSFTPNTGFAPVIVINAIEKGYDLQSKLKKKSFKTLKWNDT